MIVVANDWIQIYRLEKKDQEIAKQKQILQQRARENEIISEENHNLIH